MTVSLDAWGEAVQLRKTRKSEGGEHDIALRRDVSSQDSQQIISNTELALRGWRGLESHPRARVEALGGAGGMRRGMKNKRRKSKAEG